MDFAPLLLDPVPTRTVGAALSVVLLAGAWQKLRDPAVFRAAVENYRLLPDSLVPAIALLLPLWEAAAGVLLLLPALRPVGGVLAIALLLTVSGAVALNLLRGHTNIDCGCGSLTGHVGEQTLSWALVARNALLVAGVVFALAEEGSRLLVWIDYLSVAGGTLALLGLYIAANQLMANQPRLAALKNH